MTMISEGIKDILVEKTVGAFGPQVSTSTWAIYIGKQPDENHDRVLTIYDIVGQPANPRYLLDFPAIMINIRGEQNAYVETYNKAVHVKSALLGYIPHDRGGDRWDAINMLGDVGFIGYDKNNRPEFSTNFALIIEPAAPTGTNREPL